MARYKAPTCPKCGERIVRHNMTKNPNARRQLVYVCIGCGKVPWECTCERRVE